ncbi:MAG: outer membrane beta-barrel protein [Acidocella sp.]|nr:outer membrane beta-barrel protein [Acidocella sp.]
MKKSLYFGMFGAAALSLAAVQPAAAQSASPAGFQAGDFLVRLRVIDVIPENFSSSVSAVGGHVNASQQVAPELDLSYFITNHFSVEAIAATTRHSVWASGTAIGRVDVGSVWALPPTITLQYHLSPIAGFQPYAGVGLTVAFFYGSHANGGTIKSASFSTAVGPTLNVGFDYALGGNWYANVDLKQMFISTTAHLNHGAIIAKTSLSPTVVGVGIGYRF